MFAVALLAQAYGLYTPDQPGPSDFFPNADKVAHGVMFAAVAYTAVRAFGRAGLVLTLLLAHAVASELIQHFLLATRSGDPLDAVSDAVGSLVGVGLARRHRRLVHDDRCRAGQVRVTSGGER